MKFAIATLTLTTELLVFRIEVLYTPVFLCEDGVIMFPPEANADDFQFDSCEEYYDDVADSMRDRSFLITYGYIGIIAATMIGNMLLFYGFNIASEKMNKRVRDAAFKSLVRQEVGYFDVHPVAILTSRMSDDAALLHSFSGEPIRTLIMNIASVLVGLGKFFFLFGECMPLFCISLTVAVHSIVVSFVYMWPFALVTL